MILAGLRGMRCVKILKLRRQGQQSSAGFTLVEVVIATALLVLFAVGAVAAMTQMNRYAASSKLQTLALAIAKQRTDQIAAAGWTVNGQGARPPILAVTDPANPPGTLDPNGGDPVVINDDVTNVGSNATLDAPVNARRYTFIRNVNARTLRAVVVVTYTYRGRPYRVQLTTLRCSDDV